MSKLTAKVIPFSSVVGGGVTLHDETGRVIGQLALRNFMPPEAITDRIQDAVNVDFEAFKTGYVAMCERIAAAINAGQAEGQVTHFKKPDVAYDIVASEALFQVSAPSMGDGKTAFKPRCRMIEDQQPVTVYRNPDSGMHFVRFPDEMVSPRFEKV